MTNKAVHSALTEITLNNENFQRLFSDHKCTSVRLGNKDITPGAAMVRNVDTGETLPINIWYVNHCLLSDLELNDARLDGFATVEDMKAALRRAYQRPISDREAVTQIHFDAVKSVAA
ncbi:hypothetical protein E1100_25705 [Vibrio owensii]|uniref:ASCH domain-containing protein n=1 Tax=Vibrio owensii TaxID=696485 RepID=UPI00104FDA31|nr:ASCH domain-containing protein [Vibrio owensii]TDE19258.1 hypothetical protein E1100_25705 [Vibrio owensii]